MPNPITFLLDHPIWVLGIVTAWFLASVAVGAIVGTAADRMGRPSDEPPIYKRPDLRSVTGGEDE